MVDHHTATLVLVVLLLVGCSSGPDGSVSVPAGPTDVASPALYASAVERGCVSCRGTVYIVDHFGTNHTTGPIPDAIRAAISDVYDDVRFITLAQRDQLIGADLAAPPGSAIVAIGQVIGLAPGVVGIDVATTTDSWFVHTMLFSKQRDEWVPTTSEDTGVTVTSAVS